MKSLRTLMSALVLAAMATLAGAAAPEMANLVPADAKALIETQDLAGLRQDLLASPFWAALEKTQASQDWKADPRHAERRQRVETLLEKLEMDKDAALKTYVGGRSAVVLLPSGEKKPYGVILTEVTNDVAQRLIDAMGGEEVERHGDVAIWEVRKENRTDRMAFAGGVLLVSGAESGDALERVLDVIGGSGASLGADSRFAEAVKDLPAGWRARAFAAEVRPLKQPGAVAMYPEEKGRVHFEWRMVGGAGEFAPMAVPTVLASPAALPESTVAAVSSVFHPEAIWDFAKAKAATKENGEEGVRKVEMFIRGWFPGHSMESILRGLGPEAALAILKGTDGGAPGLLGLVRLTETGGPVAKAFKDGLAAKAMILAALGNKQGEAPKLGVREEGYGQTQVLIIEAPAVLEKVLGDWAKDVALTVAVTDQWLIVGTSLSGVKATIDSATAKGPSLASTLGTDAPAADQPLTRWGIVEPAKGTDIVLAFAERLAGKEKVDQARKLFNLAELMQLVKRVTWRLTASETAIQGQADIQATE